MTINGAYSLAVSTVGIQDANGVWGTTSKAATWTQDFTAPTISSIARNNPATVNSSGTTATWRATFSEAVTGVDVADFQLTLVSGSATPSRCPSSAAGPGAEARHPASEPPTSAARRGRSRPRAPSRRG